MLPFHRTARPSRPWASFTHLLILIPLLALGACAASSDDSTPAQEEEEPPAEDPGITSGTIGDLTFTVLSGKVFQDDTTAFLTTDADGAIIVFDSAISTLVSTPTDMFYSLQVALEDGGIAAVGAFGLTTDSFDGSLVTSLTRSGADLTSAAQNGLPGNPTNQTTSGSTPADAAGTLHISTDWFNSATPSNQMWDSETIPSSGCPGNLGTGFTQGNGDTLGVGFSGAEIQDITVSDPVNNC